MSDKLEDIVDNLKQPSHWMRLPFMVAFSFALYFFVPVIILLMIAQVLFALLTGKSNDNLRAVGATLAQWVAEIVEYITYKSNDRPYPFDDSENKFSPGQTEETMQTKSAVSTNQTERSQEVKKAKKAKKSTAKTKAAKAEGATPTKKPAKKKAPAKKKIAVAKTSPTKVDDSATKGAVSTTDVEPGDSADGDMG